MFNPDVLKAATVKWFCSFDCTEEAVGEVAVDYDGEKQYLPICQHHLDNIGQV